MLITTAPRQQQRNLNDLLGSLHMAYPINGFVSTEPACKWDFGTIAGNGVQGALAFCRTTDEEIVLSHEELFIPRFPFPGYLPIKEHHERIRELVLDGKAEEAQDVIHRLKEDGGFPRYNGTDPFAGAGSLDLLMPDGGVTSGYLRSTDFDTGEAVVGWQDSLGLFHRRFFLSRTDDVLAIKIISPSGKKLDIALRLREIKYEPPTDPRDEDIYQKTIDGCEGTIAPYLLTHRMHYKRLWEKQPVTGSCTVARVIPNGGTAEVKGGMLQISQAEDLLLLVRTVPERRGETLSVEAITAALMDLEPDYEALLTAHASAHKELMNRCTISLSDSSNPCQSVESMQAASCIGNTTPALVAKAFAAARFGIVSSTGNLPPALQGVWTGTWKPQWSGDYTLNGNVQSMVAASLCGNHFECQESLMNYLDSLMDDFRSNARELFGYRGPLIPWRASTHGRTLYSAYKNHHNNFPGIYWVAGAAWFAQLYYDYYLYTGDENFFETRLKPFLLESVEFYEDYLVPGPDGRFIVCPDSSPENETSPDIRIAPNATMSIAAIKQLLRTLLRLKNKLHVDDGIADKWRAMLSKMPPYTVGINGALKEWTWPGIENNEAHRHASHLYPLYYGVDPEIEASDELHEACKVAIENRLAFMRSEKDGFMAFAFTQLGMSAAHLGDTRKAYEAVEYLVNNYWSPAMVSQHNYRDVLNMDISGGLQAVIITILIQSLLPVEPYGTWVIRLLPCLPEEWPEGTLRGVRCRGGFELSIEWRNRRLKAFTITSLLGAPCRLEFDGRSLDIHLGRGKQLSHEVN